MNELLIRIILCLITFFIGISIGGALVSSYAESDLFFQVRFFEIVKLICTIFIALFATYVITSKINNTLKVKELILNLLETFQDSIIKLHNSIEQYTDKPDDETKKNILATFKHAQSLLSIIKDSISINNNKLINIDTTIYSDFNKFKISATDSPFGNREPEFTASRIRKINDKYFILIAKINKCKILLYSK